MSSNPSLIQATIPRLNRYIKQVPTPKQAAFLLLDCFEAFYGGAAGGGKSSALLMAAAQYVDIPGYNALLLRTNFKQLTKPSAIMDRAKRWWLGDSDIHWDPGQYTFTFPSGARIVFGHLQGPDSHYDYDSSEWHFIGGDEVSKMRWYQLNYLMSRMRRVGESAMEAVPEWLPLRFRTGSNPGGRSASILRQRYIDPKTQLPGVVFIPAKIADNPYLNRAEYERTLDRLDPITKARLLHGDWDVQEGAQFFERQWFELVDAAPVEVARRVRFWDMAATEAKLENKDPDWTVGFKMSKTRQGLYYIEHVLRFRKNPGATEEIIRQTADADGRSVVVAMEQEPGSSGKTVIHNFRKMLSSYIFKGYPPSGSKVVRAGPFASQCESGNVYLVKGPWVNPFLDEIDVFPSSDAHDDQVDAGSGAYHVLNDVKQVRAAWA